MVFCLLGCAVREQSIPKRVWKTRPAIVNLQMTDIHGKSISYGWGVFVSSIYIVANLHTVAWTAAGTANSIDIKQSYPIRGIAAIDQENDLVLLKCSIPNFRSIRLADSNNLQNGERVYITANPILQRNITHLFFIGTTITRVQRKDNKKSYLRADTSSQLHSCLPVLNGKGEVVGVTSNQFIGEEKYNIVIPSNYVNALFEVSKNIIPLADTKRHISEETYLYRGNEKFKRRLYKEAIADYDKALRLKPDYDKAYLNRGLSKANQGKTLEAKQDLQTALNLVSNAGDVNLKKRIESALNKLK